MTQHTLAVLTYPPTHTSLREVLRGAELFPATGPLTVDAPQGSGSMRVRDVRFDGRVIGEVQFGWNEAERGTDLRITFEAREFVPEAVHESIANRLRVLATQTHALIEARIGRERDAQAQIDALLGAPDHPRVRAVVDVPKAALGAFCYPGVLQEAAGDNLRIRHIEWHTHRVVASVDLVNGDVSLPAFRVEENGEEIAVLGTGKRDRARSAVVQDILERSLAICQTRVASPTFQMSADALRTQILDLAAGYDEALDECGHFGSLVRLTRGTPDEVADISRDYANSITRQAHFEGGLRWGNSQGTLPLSGEGELTDVGNGFAVRKVGVAPKDVQIIEHDGVRIFDSRAGFLPGISEPHRSALLLALAEVMPAQAKRLPWAEAPRPDPQKAHDAARFNQRLLAHFGAADPSP